MKRASVISVLLVLAVCAPVFAAESKPDETRDLTIDLASAPSVSVRAPGTYRIHLINRIPRAKYSVSSRIVSDKVAQPFDIAGLKPKAAVSAVADCTSDEKTLADRLDTVTTEQDVAALRQTYRSKLPNCTEEQQQEFGQQLEASTQWDDTAALPALDAGDSLFVTVVRQAAAGVAQQVLGTWQFEFGKREAQWLTFYGFNFAQSGDDSFFTEANAGSNPPTFTITKGADRSDNSFSPSVYLFRLPAQQTGARLSRWWGWRGQDTFGGVTAGLGFDFDNPTVFLGYGVGWGYNVMLTAGVVMHKEKRLNGQYDSGDVVAENLTADQLLDATYKPRAYVGLAFRFGSNPFSGDDEPAPAAEGKGAEKPKEK